MTLASPAPQNPALLLPGADFGCIKAAAKQTPLVLTSPGVSLRTPRLQCPIPFGPYELSKSSFKTNNLPKTHLWSIMQLWLGSMSPSPVCTQGSEQALPQ